MRFEANEQTIPRVNLIGTLAIVAVLTLSLGAYFSWSNAAEHQASLERIAQTNSSQQEAHLKSELDSAISYIDFTRKRTDDVLRKSIREQVETAVQMANAIYVRESGRRPAAEVQRLIIEALRPVRFYEGRGYYFIDDMQGKFILLPTAPHMEGKTILDNQDDRGHFIMRGLIEAARQPQGQGYSRYRWYSPDSPKEMADKLAYVQYFEPYGWLIGTGDYTYKWEELQKKEAIARLRTLRFGISGYIGLVDSEGRSLLSPSNEALEGKHFSDMDPQEAAAIRKIVDLARSGGGLLRYMWPVGTDRRMVAKTALVHRFEPWGWILVSAVNDGDLQEALRSELVLYDANAQKRWSELAIALMLALATGLVASLSFATWSRSLFKRYHDDNLSKSQAIQESGALFRAVFENAAVGIAQVGLDGRFLQINESYCRIIGYSQDEILGQGFTVQRLTFPEDLEVDAASAAKMVSGDTNTYQIEKRYLHKSGGIVWVSLASNAVRSADGKPLYFITAVHDITERKKYEERLKLASTVFTHAREGILITDAQGCIIDVNDTFTEITGYSRDEVIGQNPRLLSSGRQEPEFYTNMWAGLTEKGHWYGEIWNRRKNGEIFAEMLTISAVCDAQGCAQNYVALFSDITSQKEHQNQLEHIAHYDALTNLPNRVLLADRLKQAMAQAQRRGERVAVAYLDIDGFKSINDRHGHHIGDQLLVTIASAMKQALREGDTLARLGGDEFVAVLLDLEAAVDSAPMLQRLLQAAAHPVQIDGHAMQVSASLGVTFYPQEQDMDADQLLRQADQAMYLAKLAGKNRYQVFDATQDSSLRVQHESLERIRLALERREFVLYYQPKVNMRTGEVIGAEALIRWQHPENGLMSPAAFLPIIENHHLSVDVGDWVIDTALTQIERWRDEGLEIPVSVNVGARQLQQGDFFTRLRTHLESHPGVKPSLLELEVLETSALEDVAQVSRLIESCAEIGVMFALDDFGTGYSSLTYLKRLRVDVLKIDQSFVRDMLEDPDDLAILQGVIGLAAAFKRRVIAEGVETVAHGSALINLGCDLAQGYGVAKPMPCGALPQWVSTWKPDPTWVSLPDPD